MPWIFSSFLVTLCALTSCHVVISKQGSMIRALRLNRCVTRRRPHDENHVVRFGQSAENRSWVRDTQPSRGVADELGKGCKHWHPLAPGRRYGKKKSSLLVYASTHFSNTTETSTLLRIKCKRYIFIKKYVHSFIEVRKLCLIMFPFVFVLWLSNIWVFGAMTRTGDQSMVLISFWDSSRNCRRPYCVFGGWKMHLYCTLMHACRDSQPHKEWYEINLDNN